MFELRKPVTPEQFDAYYDLRWRILRAPWNQPRGSEQDEFEDRADHVMAIDASGRLVGVGRLHINSDVEAQIRYMAVEAECRGQGVGRAIVQHLEQLAVEHRVERVVLNARDAVVGFYERIDYRVVGEGPTLFGDVGHRRMEKRVAAD